MTGSAATPMALPARPRILVVTLRRIGDALLTTPLIRSIRRAWPDAEIDVLAFAGGAGIIDGNPDVDRVIAMRERPSALATLRLAGQLWKRYDLAVSTQTGDRPTAFAWLAGRRHAGLIEQDSTRPSDAIKRRALHRTAAWDGAIHRVELVLRLADALGIARVPEMVCPVAVAPKDVSPGARYAVIHAAPMFRYKQWTPEGWRAVAAGLAQRGLEIVAIGGPNAVERAYLEAVWRGKVPVHQFAWRENVALLTAAKVYVGPDTSVSHLAAAAGCPTVTLYGPTDPRLWGPWPVGGLTEPWQASGTIQRRGNVWLVQNPLPCMPCMLEGCERHIESESICLKELPAEQVLTAVDQALASRP